MKRVLLDTNIYGEIVKRGDTELVKRFVENRLSMNIAVYGNSVVRKELRDVPKKKLRTPNFENYDGFIKEIKRWLPL